MNRVEIIESRPTWEIYFTDLHIPKQNSHMSLVINIDHHKI
jgi:hypothetical protein